MVLLKIKFIETLLFEKNYLRLRSCLGKWLFEIYFFMLEFYTLKYILASDLQAHSSFLDGFLGQLSQNIIFYFSHFSENYPQFFGTFMKFAVTFEWMVQSFNFKKVKVSEFNGQSIENIWKCLKSTEKPGATFQYWSCHFTNKHFIFS